MEKIRKDFDRIALLSGQQNDTGGVYDRFVLEFVPNDCDHALEIGCGTGSFTRLLATRAVQVSGIDLSPEMIRVAKLHSANQSNISYQVGNILHVDLPSSYFDCIVMIATLHHLPGGPVLEKVKKALMPNGVVIIHDLLRSNGLLNRAMDSVRLSMSAAVRLKRTGRLIASSEERRAWAEHGKGERYLTMKEVRAMRDCYFPGGEVKEHFLWRYSVVWRKRVC